MTISPAQTLLVARVAALGVANDERPARPGTVLCDDDPNDPDPGDDGDDGDGD